MSNSLLPRSGLCLSDADFLKEMKIEVEYQTGGRCVSRCVTRAGTVPLESSIRAASSHGTIFFVYVGYVGALTGCKPGGYSVSANYRATRDGTLVDNIKKRLGSGWPVGFLVR